MVYVFSPALGVPIPFAEDSIVAFSQSPQGLMEELEVVRSAISRIVWRMQRADQQDRGGHQRPEVHEPSDGA